MSDSALDDSLSDSLEENAVNSLISLRVAAENEADSLEPGPSLDDMKTERQSRNMAAMEAIDAEIAKEMTTPSPSREESVEDQRVKAAIVIQSYFRGYIDRCKFLEMLYDEYQKEEEERRLRANEQVEEGELLVANHRLQVELADAETAQKNRERRFYTQVVTIQRTWRAYKRRCRDKEKQNPPESLSPFAQRKNNLLSMAQEFADLHSQDERVLPYNAHKATLLSDSSCESSTSSTATSSPAKENLKTSSSPQSSPKKFRNPFNRSEETIKPKISEYPASEASLPPLDWSKLESKITGTSTSTGSLNVTKSVKDAHREDVRKRLAMNTPADGLYSDVYTRRPTRGHNSVGLELYVNECNDETEQRDVKDDDNLTAKQQQLEEEATVAYIQAGPIAKRMIEVEKMAEEPSQIARMLGISTFRSQGEVTLTKKRLESLGLPQLKVVLNAYQNEIERLNEELMQSVMTRDELHMQQDSLLVNIEDQQRRIEELSSRQDKRSTAKESKRQSAAQEAGAIPKAGRMSRLFRLGKS